LRENNKPPSQSRTKINYMQIILENLYKAYFEARKNKRFTKEQQI
jgi:hypothetical protein